MASKYENRAAKLFGLDTDRKKFGERLATQLKNAGVKNLNSQNDIRTIKKYLETNSVKNTTKTDKNTPSTTNTPDTTVNPNVTSAYETKVNDMQARIDEMTQSIKDREASYNEKFNLQNKTFGELISGERAAFETKLGGLTSQLADKDAKFTSALERQQTAYQNQMNTMQSTLMGQMNPAYRNPVMGIRFAGANNLNRQGLNTTFGRTGARIQGIKNTSLNVN